MTEQPRDADNGRFVTITNREIYHKLNEIEDKVDEVAKHDLPKRVRALELRFYGILAGVVGGGGLVYALEKIGGGP